MKFRIRSIAAAAMATGAVLAMSAGSAWAVPLVTIDTSAITGGAPTTYTGTKFSGSSSELLVTNATATGHDATGWLQFATFDNGATPQVAFGNLGTFGLFISFTLKDTYAGGGTGINTANSVNNLDVLDFRVWADSTKDNVFTPASAAGAGTNATYTNGGNDILLGFGTLIAGVSGFNSGGGAHLNSVEAFSLCTASSTAYSGLTNTSAVLDAAGNTFAAGCANGVGKAFFALPDPFYTLAFDELNNTLQGVTRGTNGSGQDIIAINEATGAVDFNNVPEPGSIALLGIALAGLGVSVRRSKKTLL